ncbi:MAG: hypothetical protein QOH51_600 [Acidobacteriota bacterium]|jgi:uncharacterized protein (DUF58 family)|nr:hypothetical protein [Acidobacteriota bacterium]
MKRWRNTILGTLVVLSGVGAAILTVVARRSGDWDLTRLGAIASLVFALVIVIFVVPPLARSARAEASRLDLSFQVTAGGIVFLSIYAVVAFAAWNTGNNLLFLIFAVLTSTLFVAWTAGRSALRDLVVTARFPDHIFAGDPAPVIVTVNNTKRLLPSLSVVVEARSRIEGAEGRRLFRRLFRRRVRERKRVLAYFMYVPRRAKVEQRVEQTFMQRGRVLVTGFELSTRFPFGFFRLRRRLRARDVEIVVYPKPEPASDELHLLPIDAGQLEAERRGAGHDLHSLREYQPRDDVRHVDWKATARQKRLIVREFTAEDERRVHIVLDTFVEAASKEAAGVKGIDKEASGVRAAGVKAAAAGVGEPGVEVAGDRDVLVRFERAVTLAASLVAHFIDERAEVRLTDGEEGSRYGVGREHLYASLRRLGLVSPRRATTDAPERRDFWQRIEPATPAAGYVILITTAPHGTIPAELWRKSHVIHV